MCHVLVEHFGTSGKVEARKLLERRASEAFPEAKNPRLLGAFNESVDNWLDFYAYTCFVDRDGKFQLGMLKPCGFSPLARSAGPMLREEAFHLGSGNDGLTRIVKARRNPVQVGVGTLVGREAVVREPGWVVVEGERWRARADDGKRLVPGQRVSVAAVEDGLELVVHPLPSNERIAS